MFQVRWLWKNMGRKYRILYIMALTLSAVTSVMLLINPYLTSLLIDDVIIAQNPDPLIPLLAGMMAVQVTRLGMRYLMVISFEISSQHVLYNLRTRLFEVLQFQESSFFDRNRTGDLMTRLSGDLDWCRHFLSYLCYQVVDCVMMFTSTLVLLFLELWK